MAYKKEIQLSKEALSQATTLCQLLQKKLEEKSVRKKADQSFVSVADFASQILISSHIQREFPNDAILAEEEASLLLQDPELFDQVLQALEQVGLNFNQQEILNLLDRQRKGKSKERFWALDPIDGTAGFVKNTHYAIALALIENGSVCTAALCCPNLEKDFPLNQNPLYAAVRGQGTYCQERKIQVQSSNRESIICVSPNPQHSSLEAAQELAKNLHSKQKFLPVHGQCKYALLIEGLADVYHRKPLDSSYREKIWDHAAGYLLLKEAGGLSTDIRNNELIWNFNEELIENFGICASSHKKIHEQIFNPG